MRDHPLALAAGPSPTSRRRATIADACRCHVTSNLHHTANMANPRGWQRQCEPGTRGSKPLPRAAKEVEELRAQPGDPACRPAFGFDPRQQPDRQLGGRGGVPRGTWYFQSAQHRRCGSRRKQATRNHCAHEGTASQGPLSHKRRHY